MWKHYVYIHYRQDAKTPFYIGKGHLHSSMVNGGRKLYYARAAERYNRSRLWNSIAKKHEVEIVIFASCQTDAEAQQIEIDLIKKFGRIDLSTGILANMTDGGDGLANLVVTDELRKKRSIRMLSSPVTPEWRASMTEGRRKVVSSSQIKKGQKLSPTWRANLAKGKLGSKNPFYRKPTPISKPVINISTGTVYQSIPRAAKAEGIDLDLLYRCIFKWRKVNLYPHIQLVQDGM